MTKSAMRRQERERQLREQQQMQEQGIDTPISEATPASGSMSPRPNIPHMDPPPPYDAPHRPRNHTTSRSGQNNSGNEESGCLLCGPGESTGCMNYNSGTRGAEYRVDGCMNYDSSSGCMNYESEGGCMNYRSSGGAMNYESHDGCMNYEVEENGGCLNFRSNRGGCMQFGHR